MHTINRVLLVTQVFSHRVLLVTRILVTILLAVYSELQSPSVIRVLGHIALVLGVNTSLGHTRLRCKHESWPHSSSLYSQSQNLSHHTGPGRSSTRCKHGSWSHFLSLCPAIHRVLLVTQSSVSRIVQGV